MPVPAIGMLVSFPVVHSDADLLLKAVNELDEKVTSRLEYDDGVSVYRPHTMIKAPSAQVPRKGLEG